MLVSGFFVSIFAYAFIPFNECADFEKEAVKFSANDVTYLDIYKTKRNRPTKLKYILLWTQNRNYLPFKNGQTSFIENNCPQVDCYFTNDKGYFGGPLKKFDAILFNGVSLNEDYWPSTRYDHQKYIYFNRESPSYYPVCKSMFDNYFNWTYTYRLNSDILLLCFEIRNKNDEIVGPRLHMKWMRTKADQKLLNSITIKWLQKSHAAVWMVTNCNNLNPRDQLALQIQKSLNKANLSLAIYGVCGDHLCPREKLSECWKSFERKYYFYLSFENSNWEDYVTEKILYPLQHYIIPIVYGGAKYSRFLPRHSYLDASKLSPDELVAKMIKIMSSFAEYVKYFKWRSKYTYTDATRNNVCGLCSALHNRTMMDTSKSYEKFREWWEPNYKKSCKNSFHYLT